MRSELLIKKLLEGTGIEVNGRRPWDPQVHDLAFYDLAVSKGSIGVGEGYMHGLWDCDDLPEFFARITAARVNRKMPWGFADATVFLGAVLQNRQNRTRALKVGKMHYDLPVEVWQATLDETMTGSCAYYRTGNETLEEAEEAKKKLTFDKLGMKEGETLLDIGVGWGSFAGYALEHYRARPIGVTISPYQRDYIAKRYGGAIDVRVHDYRSLALGEPVDKIVSAEMFEHVGRRNYRTFFTLARKWLKPDGRMLLHTIVMHYVASSIDPWMNKYIYPEGYLPTVGQIGTAVGGLFHVEDVHDIGAHYDPTLRAWIAKFRRNRDAVKALGAAKLGMDPEVFCRMWEYHYLASAGGFRSRFISVHQYVLSPNGIPGGLPRIR